MKSLAVLGVAAAIFASVSLAPAYAQEVAGSATVTGAGSTFAYPIVSRWSKAYQQHIAGSSPYRATGGGLDDPPAGLALDYEPVGSLAGTMRVRAGLVDFGASDVPLKSEDLRRLGLAQFPIVIGGVAAVVNVEGVGPGAIRFTGPLLADIFMGKIQNWSDPAIKAINPDLKLPDAKIAVIYRSDGSGTTYNFTNYLAKVSAPWRDGIGFDLNVRWPTGTGAKGNDGVARAVSQTKNSIAYVEFAQAVLAKLSYAAIQNRSGEYVQPSRQSFQTAAASADWAKTTDFDLLMTDVPRDGAYPIVATVFALMQKSTSARRNIAALKFFAWSLDSGADAAAELGYVPLPPDLVKQVKQYWTTNLNSAF